MKHLTTLLLTLLFMLASVGEAKTPIIQERGPERADSVRFLMFNVEDYFVAGEQQRSRYTITPKPEAKREAVAELIAEGRPEIVGLIEIGGEQALADLQERLEARGLSLPHGKVLTRQGEDRALAILSAYPIVANDSKADAPLYGEQRRNMLRGILDVTVKHTDGRKWRIVGVHLKAQVGKDPAAADSLRKREAETLALHIAGIRKNSPKTPLLLFGDMNDAPDSPALARLGQVLERLSPCDSRGEEWTLYFRKGQTPCTFDQLWVDSALRRHMGKQPRCGIIDKRLPVRSSGHRPVWCELK